MSTNDDKITEMYGDIKMLITEVKNFSGWLKAHEKKDKEVFDKIRQKISSLSKFATALGTVTFILGYWAGRS